VITDQDFDRPEIAAEVREVFERYEAALRDHDVAALNDFFLPRAMTVRYGLAEHNYGAEEIARYRRSASPIHPRRRILKVVIATFGPDVAVVSAEFASPDSSFIGRQSQTWIRVAEGWKIAAAHVSAIDPASL
jgi:ketosteroid isomerase-like protein